VAVETERLTLRLLRADEAPLSLAFYEQNRAHLRAWEPRREPSFYTIEAHNRLVAGAWLAAEQRRAFLWAMFQRDAPGQVAGFIHLNSVESGVFQSARLGYKLAEHAQGKGLMREGLEAVISGAFGRLNLHRLEANYMVENHRSARVLRSLGFDIVGMERDYLFLDGAWRDHILTSKKNPNWKAPERSER
jgi:[ribosomal protein S5]-alanine N-acetyltransferase